MILVAVIVGYVLGIAPFIYKEIKENRDIKKQYTESEEEQTTIEQIIDEYLNGEVNKSKETSQEDLFNEYMTGKPTKGE